MIEPHQKEFDLEAEQLHGIFMDYLKQYDGPLKDLAVHIKISYACLVHFKNKNRNPSRITLNRIERYLINNYKTIHFS
jgi:hypothetical protein